MLKKIYNYSAVVIGALLMLSSCKDDDDKIKTYSSLVDVTNTSLQFSKYDLNLLFSTDEGKTFVEYPMIKPGQKYRVKVNLHNSSDIWIAEDGDLLTADHYNFDWSGSNPKRVGEANGDVAEFVAGENNSVLLKVADACPYQASDWAGSYSASEDGGSAYTVTLTADPTVPNRFVISNFYDDKLSAYIDFSNATGTVKFPDQVAGEEQISASSGVYKSCTGEIAIKLNYDGGDWIYKLKKK